MPVWLAAFGNKMLNEHFHFAKLQAIAAHLVYLLSSFPCCLLGE